MYDRTTCRPGDLFDVILSWSDLWNIVLPKEVKRKPQKISMDTLISSPTGVSGVGGCCLSWMVSVHGEGQTVRKGRGDKEVHNSCFAFCMNGRDRPHASLKQFNVIKKKRGFVFLDSDDHRSLGGCVKHLADSPTD